MEGDAFAFESWQPQISAPDTSEAALHDGSSRTAFFILFIYLNQYTHIILFISSCKGKIFGQGVTKVVSVYNLLQDNKGYDAFLDTDLPKCSPEFKINQIGLLGFYTRSNKWKMIL